ncbi:MAG: DUF7676 family protein [Methylocystis sp.]
MQRGPVQGGGAAQCEQSLRQDLLRHWRPRRAGLRRLSSRRLRMTRGCLPMSWGLRLFNGANEQQITVLLPNPFLEPQTDGICKQPDWSRLALWDKLRARWFGLHEPDPIDRSAGFSRA